MENLQLFASGARDVLHFAFVSASDQLYALLGDFIPKLLLSFLVFFIGYACAVLLKQSSSGVLKLAGFDLLSAKAGLRSVLRRGGIDRDPSWLAGAALYWTTLFTALVLAFETLGLGVAGLLIKKAIFYVPQIVVSLLLVSLGVFLGRFLGRLVEKASYLASVPGRNILGSVTQFAVVGLAVVMALENLEVASNTLLLLFLFFFVVAPFAGCVLLFVGGREVIACLLAGHFARREVMRGDTITVDGSEGMVEAIGAVHTRLRTPTGSLLVPNVRLVRTSVSRRPRLPGHTLERVREKVQPENTATPVPLP